MICWSCEKNAGGATFCAACGAIQPPDPAADHFQVLGVERRYAVDVAELERRYKELTRQLHPDRFARADARARRASLQRSVQLNEAWRTLRDERRRAEYLLALAGIELGGEEGTRRIAADGSKVRVPVPQDLLMEVLELREALMEARLASDDAQVRALAGEVEERRNAAMSDVAAGMGQTPADLDGAARALVAVRYYDRFLDEVMVHEEAAAGRAGVGHAG